MVWVPLVVVLYSKVREHDTEQQKPRRMPSKINLLHSATGCTQEPAGAIINQQESQHTWEQSNLVIDNDGGCLKRSVVYGNIIKNKRDNSRNNQTK